MREFCQKLAPGLLVDALAFYLLPLIIRDTGGAIFVLLLGLPMICLVTALIFGVRHGFHWAYPAAVALLFLPSVFLFYNASAVVYIAAYGILSLVGVGLGAWFHRDRTR